jgi:galactokinase/mevalonate kinase-like predicted kinase
MATSSHKKAVELWQVNIPAGNREDLGRILFSCENPPGSGYVSGSQDALGIVLPGLNKLNYEGSYWPSSIESFNDDAVLNWIEQHSFLVPLSPREEDYDVYEKMYNSAENVKRLAKAAETCLKALLNKDLAAYGASIKDNFEAQTAIFPNMIQASVKEGIEKYRDAALGWKLCGSGGGGYLFLIADKQPEGSINIRIRRAE